MESPTTIMIQDYYAVLGVACDASDTDIKKAYRKMALRYHPDKIGKEADQDMFKVIAHAYSILSDTESKAAYDSKLAKRKPKTTSPNKEPRYHYHGYRMPGSSEGGAMPTATKSTPNNPEPSATKTESTANTEPQEKASEQQKTTPPADNQKPKTDDSAATSSHGSTKPEATTVPQSEAEHGESHQQEGDRNINGARTPHPTGHTWKVPDEDSFPEDSPSKTPNGSKSTYSDRFGHNYGSFKMPKPNPPNESSPFTSPGKTSEYFSDAGEVPEVPQNTRSSFLPREFQRDASVIDLDSDDDVIIVNEQKSKNKLNFSGMSDSLPKDDLNLNDLDAALPKRTRGGSKSHSIPQEFGKKRRTEYPKPFENLSTPVNMPLPRMSPPLPRKPLTASDVGIGVPVERIGSLPVPPQLKTQSGTRQQAAAQYKHDVQDYLQRISAYKTKCLEALLSRSFNEAEVGIDTLLQYDNLPVYSDAVNYDNQLSSCIRNLDTQREMVLRQYHEVLTALSFT